MQFENEHLQNWDQESQVKKSWPRVHLGLEIATSTGAGFHMSWLLLTRRSEKQMMADWNNVCHDVNSVANGKAVNLLFSLHVNPY